MWQAVQVMTRICRESEASLDYGALFKAMIRRAPLPMSPLESLASSAVRTAHKVRFMTHVGVEGSEIRRWHDFQVHSLPCSPHGPQGALSRLVGEKRGPGVAGQQDRGAGFRLLPRLSHPEPSAQGSELQVPCIWLLVLL